MPATLESTSVGRQDHRAPHERARRRRRLSASSRFTGAAVMRQPPMPPKRSLERRRRICGIVPGHVLADRRRRTDIDGRRWAMELHKREAPRAPSVLQGLRAAPLALADSRRRRTSTKRFAVGDFGQNRPRHEPVTGPGLVGLTPSLAKGGGHRRASGGNIEYLFAGTFRL